jgi:tetratricopeptide (TPR) repeat protein
MSFIKPTSALMPSSAYINSLLEEQNLLERIADSEKAIKKAIQVTSWPMIEEVKKVSSFIKLVFTRIGIDYLKLAKFHFENKGQLEKSKSYLANSLKNLKKFCEYSTDDQNITYQNWYQIANGCLLRLKMDSDCTPYPGLQDKKKTLNIALNAINMALKIERNPHAIELKWLFVKLLDESNFPHSEDSIKLFKDHLDNHPQPLSNQYLEVAQIYGAELARIGNCEKAIEWFQSLLEKKKDAITYLHLGKVYDSLKDYTTALNHFGESLKLDPNNLEIQLWTLTTQVRQKLKEFESMEIAPTSDKVEELIDLFNRFCAIFPDLNHQLDEQTSTFVPFRELADYMYTTLVPRIADLLAKLQQFKFAAHLYETILENYNKFVFEKCLTEAQIAPLYTALGACYLNRQEFEKAEEYFNKAIEHDKNYMVGLQNLAAVYALKNDEQKLDRLADRIKLMIKDSHLPTPKSIYSSILSNLGGAYASFAKEHSHLEKALPYLQLAIEDDPSHFETRLLLARIFVLLGHIDESEKHLKICHHELTNKDRVFGINDESKHIVNFCYASVMALKGDIKAAQQHAIEAGKIRFDLDESHNLMQYISGLREEKIDKDAIYTQLKEAVGKISFKYRLGKMINHTDNRSFEKGALVGYHGTTDFFLEDIQKEIKPCKAKDRQYKGDGFYIAVDREVASYFAFKKAKEEGKGKPIILKVQACRELIGKSVPSGYKTKLDPSKEGKRYDFIQSKINGFEAYSQYYIFESSLEKIKAQASIEQVVWSDKEYQKFVKDWARY